MKMVTVKNGRMLIPFEDHIKRVVNELDAKRTLATSTKSTVRLHAKLMGMECLGETDLTGQDPSRRPRILLRQSNGFWTSKRLFPVQKKQVLKVRYNMLWTLSKGKTQNPNKYPCDICPLCRKGRDTPGHRLNACMLPVAHKLVCARHGNAVHRVAQAVTKGTRGNCYIYTDAEGHTRYPIRVGRRRKLPKWILAYALQTSKPDLILFPTLRTSAYSEATLHRFTNADRASHMCHVVEFSYTNDINVHAADLLKAEQQVQFVHNMEARGWRVKLHTFILGLTGVFMSKATETLLDLGISAPASKTLLSKLQDEGIARTCNILFEIRKAHAILRQQNDADQAHGGATEPREGDTAPEHNAGAPDVGPSAGNHPHPRAASTTPPHQARSAPGAPGRQNNSTSSMTAPAPVPAPSAPPATGIPVPRPIRVRKATTRYQSDAQAQQAVGGSSAYAGTSIIVAQVGNNTPQQTTPAPHPRKRQRHPGYVTLTDQSVPLPGQPCLLNTSQSAAMVALQSYVSNTRSTTPPQHTVIGHAATQVDSRTGRTRQHQRKRRHMDTTGTSSTDSQPFGTSLGCQDRGRDRDEQGSPAGPSNLLGALT